MIERAFFFKEDKYVAFEVADDTVGSGYPLPIGDFWPGMRDAGFDADLDAVVDWGTGKVYFFKGDLYVRYDVDQDAVDPGYPLSIAGFWPGMSEAGFDSDLDAAVNWGTGKVYFFKGDQYVSYDVAADRVDPGYPLSIAEFWPGMRDAGFAANLDAALNWGNGNVYFFKGSEYVRYNVADDKVDPGYPVLIRAAWTGMREARFAAGVKAATSLTSAFM
jgi:hypothetical protein